MERRKRIALSVRPEYHEKLTKMAAYQGVTMTTVVTDLLNECEGAVDIMLKAYAEIHSGVDKNKVLTNMLADGFGMASEKLKQE
jgi:hypothetical protein